MLLEGQIQLRGVHAPVVAGIYDPVLKELERDGLRFRTVYLEVSPRVEYTLTDLGNSASPVLGMMHLWGVNQLGLVQSGQAVGPGVGPRQAIDIAEIMS